MLKLVTRENITAVFVLLFPFTLLLCARIAKFIVSDEGRQLYEALVSRDVDSFALKLKKRKYIQMCCSCGMCCTSVQQVLAAPSS